MPSLPLLTYSALRKRGSNSWFHGFKAKYNLEASFEGVPQISIGKGHNTDHVIPTMV